MNKYDIAVIGGGMVGGAAVAVGFAKQAEALSWLKVQNPKLLMPLR